MTVPKINPVRGEIFGIREVDCMLVCSFSCRSGYSGIVSYVRIF